MFGGFGIPLMRTLTNKGDSRPACERCSIDILICSILLEFLNEENVSDKDIDRYGWK